MSHRAIAIADAAAAALARLRKLGEALAQRSQQGRVLLMNGIDHAQPDPHTKAAAEAPAGATRWRVERGPPDGLARDPEAPLPVVPRHVVGAPGPTVPRRPRGHAGVGLGQERGDGDLPVLDGNALGNCGRE